MCEMCEMCDTRISPTLTPQNTQCQGTLFSLCIFAFEVPLEQKKEAVISGVL